MAKRRSMISCRHCGSSSKLVPNAGRGLCQKHYKAVLRMEAKDKKINRETDESLRSGAEPPWNYDEFLRSST